MITLDSILYKLTHGVPPLTHEECCSPYGEICRRQSWLYTQATGEYVPTSKRCKVCEGEGEVRNEAPFFPPPLYWPWKRPCAKCGGSGKETEANSQK